MPVENKSNEPKNIFEAHIQDIFKNENTEMEVILSIVSILIFKNIRDKSILSLFKLTDVNTFTRTLALFEGRTVTFPTREEIEEIFILAVCYYYREVEELSWEEIKEIMPFNIKATTYGLKINNLSALIRKKMKELVEGAK